MKRSCLYRVPTNCSHQPQLTHTLLILASLNRIISRSRSTQRTYAHAKSLESMRAGGMINQRHAGITAFWRCSLAGVVLERHIRCLETRSSSCRTRIRGGSRRGDPIPYSVHTCTSRSALESCRPPVLSAFAAHLVFCQHHASRHLTRPGRSNPIQQPFESFVVIILPVCDEFFAGFC